MKRQQYYQLISQWKHTQVYTLLSTLEEKRRIAATHIEHSQAQQKERHDNKLPPITNEFKIGNKVFLHRTKTEKQWSGKFENKWDRPFYIHEILDNGSYKLRLDDKILAKVAHGNRLKHYYSKNNPEPLIPQIELKATNITPETIQKQIHNEFKTAAGPTNTHYKFIAASRLYDLFNTCENVLQNLIIHPMKIQYIGKLTELKFQQFSDQITSIILDHYLNITDNAWTLTELSLKEEIMLPDSLLEGIPAIKLRKKLTKLQFQEAMDKTITIESLSIIQRTQPNSSDTNLSNTNFQITINCIILQRTSTNTNLKVTKSENIGANHLGFMKSLFQHYCQHLGLNHNHISVESAFNFYINEKIAYLLGTPVNIELAREAFYSELIQNTNLPTNHNFTSIIMEINKEIEHHIQQRYLIVYANKDKEKLQTPASSTNPSYHYTFGSVINITSTGTATSNTTSAFRRFPFQSKQRKTELQLLLPPPDFRISDPWEVMKSEEEEEEEAKNQEFTYQNLIAKNPEFEIPNL
ncbi:hypothetical protein G9A89_022718 [Geosiphon pyriformis]|nr:hypothetical protein G9A89_022718 [Geosiphon pyriformis]